MREMYLKTCEFVKKYRLHQNHNLLKFERRTRNLFAALNEGEMELSDLLLLNLKNIYRLFNGQQMSGDSASMPKLTGNSTLLHFWCDLLTPALPAGTLDELFPADGKRSRSVSDLLNRTGYGGAQSALYKAFNEGFDSYRLLRLAVSWWDFLTSAGDKTGIIRDQVLRFQQRCAQEDPAIAPEIRKHLQDLADMASTGTADDRRSVFYLACQLAWLTVYAVLGVGMAKGRPIRMSDQPDFAPEALYLRATNVSYGQQVPHMLTARGSALCAQALPDELYIDRKGRVAALGKLLGRRHRVLVSGIGGAGKTELVRQLLRQLETDAVYARLAFVQYHTSWMASLKDAFPQFSHLQDSELICAVAALLDRQGVGRTLMTIDDADLTSDTIPAFLWTVGCDVIITSRQSELERFEKYRIPALTAAEARLFLEAQCRRPFSDPEQIYEGLTRLTGGHALTLWLLSRVCEAHGWTAAMLLEHAQYGYDTLSYSHYGTNYRIQDELVRELRLRDLPKEKLRELALLSLFGDEWQIPEVMALCRDISTENDLAQKLHEWTQLGWLNRDRDVYRIPPALRSVFSSTLRSLSDYPLLIRRVRLVLESFSSQMKVFSDLKVVLHVFCRFPRDPLVGDLLPEAIAAMIYIGFPEGTILAHSLKLTGQPDTDIMQRYLRMSLPQTRLQPDSQKEMIRDILAGMEKLERWTPSHCIALTCLNSMIYDAEQIMIYLSLLRQVRLKCPLNPCWALAEYTLAQLHSMVTRDSKAAKAHAEAGNALMDAHWPEHEELRLKREIITGVITYLSGMVEKAIPHLQRAEAMLESSPFRNEDELSNLYSLLGEAYTVSGDMRHAEEYVLKQFSDQNVIEHPGTLDDMAKLQNLCVFYLHSGALEKAMTINQRILRNFRRFPDMIPVDQAGTWFVRGSIYMASGRPGNAVTCFRRAESLISGVVPEDDPYMVRIREGIKGAKEMRKG